MSDKRPAFQWYPKDYLTDENVAMMTLEEEGAYRRLMDYCWLHETLPNDTDRLAPLCKCNGERMALLWPAIEGCFIPDPDSPNRLRHKRLDAERAKQDAYRQSKSDAGKRGAEARWKKVPDGSAKVLPMANDGSSSAVCSLQSPEEKTCPFEGEFEKFWKRYPNKVGKKAALKAYQARRRAGVSEDDILNGLQRYNLYLRTLGTEKQYIKQPATFVGPDEWWSEEWDIPSGSKPETVKPIDMAGQMVDDTGFANIMKPEAYGEFVARQAQPVEAVATPFQKLNNECRGDGGRQGLAYGWHVIVAGATNMGKTNLAMNLACHAVSEGHAVMFVSLEMARHQIQQRVYSILSGNESDTFSRGAPMADVPETLSAMDERVTLSGGLPPLMLVNDKPIRNIHHIADHLDDFRQKYNCRMFIVDYLQLCETGSDEDRRRQVAEISAMMMTYAHQHDALTIGLSQFNRFTTKDKSQSPEVEGMTESSALENDCDMALLLDHSKYEKDLTRPWLHRTWLKIGKNRHGGKGMVPIEWNWKNFTCREAQPDEEHLWPGSDKGER